MTTLTRLRRAGTAVGGASALTILLATPAFAATQWPNCYHGQIGSTYWRVRGDVDSINPFHGIWEDRNGNLVSSETQYIAIDGPARFRIYGEGNHQWALRGVYIDYDGIEYRGVKCEGGNELRTAADAASNISRTAPLPLTLNASVPPVPNLIFVPLVDDATEGISGT